MAQGTSIHIGLNNIDLSSPDYAGVSAPTLSGCWNDASAMEQIAADRGFDPRLTLLDGDATHDRVLGEITNAQSTLGSGDILLVTYSGHGSQVTDTSGDESDALDETWVLWDRMLVDDELSAAWDGFADGVRIVVVSDSCHSGTVSRDVYFDAPHTRGLAAAYAPTLRRIAEVVVEGGVPRATRDVSAAPQVVVRALSEAATLAAAANYRRLGRGPRLRASRAAGGATVLLLSGCQDNQLSADGTVNGLFTENLLAVWAQGTFTQGYPEFHSQILAKMPPTQSPNYLVTGAPNPNFEAEIPFTVNPVSEEQPADDGQPVDEGQPVDAGGNGEGDFGDRGADTPSVSGPAQAQRSGPPPTFAVKSGHNRYWAFEMTADPSLFAGEDRRTDDNWYASWADSSAPERYTDASYTLPADAWAHLRSVSRLWYRVCTSTDASSWDGYEPSTLDADGDHAPALQVV